MRNLLLLAFLGLTVVLAYYAYLEFNLGATLAAPVKNSGDSAGHPDTGVDLNPDESPETASGNGASRVFTTMSAAPGAFAISPEMEKQKKDTFREVEAWVESKRNAATELTSYSTKLDWVGSICSWFILAITVFLQHATSGSTIEEPPTKKSLPIKSAFIGILAVGAAVCPLVAGKLVHQADGYSTKTNEVVEQMNTVRSELGPQLDPREWENKLHALDDLTLQ